MDAGEVFGASCSCPRCRDVQVRSDSQVRGRTRRPPSEEEHEMTKVVLAMSVSLDGIAGPEAPDADGMALFTEILGWQFPLRSWRTQQRQDGGDDAADSKEG